MSETARAARPASPPAEAPEGPLRVALFAGNYDYILDGAARSLNILVRHLLDRGHEVLVFAPAGREPAFRRAGTLVPVPSVPLPGKRNEYRIGLGLTRRLRARLDAFRPDLVHIATPDLTALTALRYAERHGIPAVASFHTRFDTYPRYYGAPWLERYVTRYMRWLYARCVHVYPPTRSMLEELARDGIGRELRLWRRGVDQELFSPERRDMGWRRGLGLGDDAVVVAFVGRLVLEKGIDVFADAVRLAAAEDGRIRALVVGDGPERARFARRLPDAVFLGHQKDEALARAYASADIFFNPSVTETAGNVTLEAMASGLPTVAAEVSGSRSFVRPGETGLLASPERGAGGYARQLLHLSGDVALRVRMGEAARARTVAEHRWPAILDEVIGHYRDAIRAYGDAAGPPR